MHLGLNWPFVPRVNQRSPEAPAEVPYGPQIKGALLLQQGSRWPWCLVSYYPLGPKRRNPDMYVWVRLKPHSDLKPKWPPGSQRYSDIPHRGSRGIYPFMTTGTRRGWGVSVTPRPLFTPGKDLVPIVQEAGWAPGPVWTGAENLAPTGVRSPDCPAHSQSLYRLIYPACRQYI